MKTFSLSLKTRILLIVLGVVCCYGLIDYSIQRLIVYPRFLSLEVDSARRNMERCMEAVNGEIVHLDKLAHDWAAWDDMYRFMQGKVPDFVSSNIVSDTYGINELNLLLLVALDGTVTAGGAWDLDADTPMEIPEFPPAALDPENPLLIGSHTEPSRDLGSAAVRGIVSTQEGPLLVSARPILTSSNGGPALGSLIMGQLLTEEKTRTLMEQTRIRFETYSLETDRLPDEARQVVAHLNDQASVSIQRHDPDTLHGYAVMNDIQGTPVLLLRAELPRVISAQGTRAVWGAVSSITVTAVVILLALNAILKRAVLSPIAVLFQHVTRITETDDLTARLNMSCRHEIGNLGEAFDRMVARLHRQAMDLSGTNMKLVAEIAERRRTEERLKKSETFLQAILDTIQSGVLVVDPVSGNILHANPYAANMIGEAPGALIGRNRGDIMGPITETGTSTPVGYKGSSRHDFLLRAVSGRQFHIRRSRTTLERDGKLLLLESFQDISDIKHLLEKQEIHIATAQRLLQLTNGTLPRHVPLPENRQICIHALSAPCYALGGDHFFARELSLSERPRTIISLKDQSGHEVESVLKAIGTDLVHQSLLCKHEEQSLDAIITTLNREICSAKLLSGEEFFTSISLDIDHNTLAMQYLSTGHPPFLLIRDRTVRALPEHGRAGANLPGGFLKETRFSSARLQLGPGDRLILYSDGLTEMTVDRTGTPIDTHQLLKLTWEILSENPRKTVSQIMKDLLQAITKLSAQDVRPSEKNTSNDDVTLIGIEIESLDGTWETSFHPKDADMLAAAITSVTEDISERYRIYKGTDLLSRIQGFLEEGMVNAWRHGNRCDAGKAVTVRCHRGNDLRVEIIDEGQGVNFVTLPEPIGPENRLKTTGRGIFIMKHLTDDVSWEENGRHVVAFFRMPVEEEKYE